MSRNPPRSTNKPSRPQGIARDLRQRIATGIYTRGTRLPAEPELAAQLGVSRSTLREALNMLEQEGLVVRRQRAGTVVGAMPVVHHSLERTSGLRQMIEASGRAHSVRDALIRFIPSTNDVASELDVNVGAPLIMLERIRLADGEPIAYTVDYLDSDVVEHATSPLLPDVSFYEWLNDHCGRPISHGIARVSAIRATAEMAARLGIAEGDPLFHLRQTDYAEDGRPVLHSREFYVQDALEITVVRSGPSAWQSRRMG